MEAKKLVQAGASNLQPALMKLLRTADSTLSLTPPSVVDKTETPPSGDKHDYVSLATYYWPNPNTPNGLPYVQRDGEVNPEIYQAPDSTNFDKMTSAVQNLSLAYYFSNKEEYATKAAQYLRTWFLDASTRMNPNLKYAQQVRGLYDGTSFGIIDTHDIGRIVDGIGLIETSKTWTADDQNGMAAWFQQYLNWLLTSENGKKESNAKNNHGSWYDVQVASMGLRVSNRHFATQTLQSSKEKRIAQQVQPDGKQPLELVRTRSWSYSIFNLQALFGLAALGDSVGVDLWHYQPPSAGGIRAALDYLVPFGLKQQEWPYRQITAWDTKGLVSLLRQAADAYNEPTYIEAGTKAGSTTSGLENLIYPWSGGG